MYSEWAVVRRHNNDWKTITKCKMFSFLFDRCMSMSIEHWAWVRRMCQFAEILYWFRTATLSAKGFRTHFVCTNVLRLMRTSDELMIFSFFFFNLNSDSIQGWLWRTGKSFGKLFKAAEHSARTNRFQLMPSWTTTNERKKNNTWSKRQQYLEGRLDHALR